MVKTWEVLKALEEGVDMKFTFDYPFGGMAEFSVDDGYYHLNIFDEKGKLKVTSDNPHGGGFNGNVKLSTDWTEVPQPVTWQKALEAWINGKVICCKVNSENEFTYSNIDVLVDECGGDTISSWEIKEGTWYIEGDK